MAKKLTYFYLVPLWMVFVVNCFCSLFKTTYFELYVYNEIPRYKNDDVKQLSNKEIAMQMLKSELYQLELERQKAKVSAIEGEKKNIEWGSQIRSYVFAPYTMIKDHRTDYQVGDVNKVMEGDLNEFMYKYLEMEAKQNGKN